MKYVSMSLLLLSIGSSNSLLSMQSAVVSGEKLAPATQLALVALEAVGRENIKEPEFDIKTTTQSFVPTMHYPHLFLKNK